MLINLGVNGLNGLNYSWLNVSLIIVLYLCIFVYFNV